MLLTVVDRQWSLLFEGCRATGAQPGTVGTVIRRKADTSVVSNELKREVFILESVAQLDFQPQHGRNNMDGKQSYPPPTVSEAELSLHPSSST